MRAAEQIKDAKHGSKITASSCLLQYKPLLLYCLRQSAFFSLVGFSEKTSPIRVALRQRQSCTRTVNEMVWALFQHHSPPTARRKLITSHHRLPPQGNNPTTVLRGLKLARGCACAPELLHEWPPWTPPGAGVCPAAVELQLAERRRASRDTLGDSRHAGACDEDVCAENNQRR